MTKYKVSQTTVRVFHDVNSLGKSRGIVSRYNKIDELFHITEWELYDDNSIFIEYDDGDDFDSGFFTIQDNIDWDFMRDHEMTWLFYYDMVKNKLIVNRIYFN